MRIVRTIVALFAVSLLVAAFTTGARADTWSKKTVVTFDQPVEIPGHALPAGTYTFKLLDAAFNRNIVQVFNADETQLIATVLAINNYTLKPTGKTTMLFAERPANTPPALKAWFYPNNSWGQEFVYPKARAVQLAQETHEAIPAIETEPAPVEELKSEPIVAETPQQTEVAIAEVIPAPAPATERLAQVAAPVLPKTGSPIPLIALLGVLSISFALVVKRFAS